MSWAVQDVISDICFALPNVRYWPLADMSECAAHVRSRVKQR
jgi:hypothetical protein